MQGQQPPADDRVRHLARRWRGGQEVAIAPVGRLNVCAVPGFPLAAPKGGEDYASVCQCSPNSDTFWNRLDTSPWAKEHCANGTRPRDPACARRQRLDERIAGAPVSRGLFERPVLYVIGGHPPRCRSASGAEHPAVTIHPAFSAYRCCVGCPPSHGSFPRERASLAETAMTRMRKQQGCADHDWSHFWTPASGCSRAVKGGECSPASRVEIDPQFV
jgi:hypothetical protein